MIDNFVLRNVMENFGGNVDEVIIMLFIEYCWSICIDFSGLVWFDRFISKGCNFWFWSLWVNRLKIWRKNGLWKLLDINLISLVCFVVRDDVSVLGWYFRFLVVVLILVWVLVEMDVLGVNVCDIVDCEIFVFCVIFLSVMIMFVCLFCWVFISYENWCIV